LKRIRFN